LGEEVELVTEDGQLVIRPVCHPRHGWDEAFQRMARQGDDQLLDETAVSLTQWDGNEWEWV
jgi:antitoxin MazE